MTMFNESEQRGKYHSSVSFCVPFLYWKRLYKKFSLHFFIYFLIPVIQIPSIETAVSEIYISGH